MTRFLFALSCLLPWLGTLLLACGNPVETESVLSAPVPATPGPGEAVAGPGSWGVPVTPAFPVQGDLEGLLLVWFDSGGLHTAQRRSQIPEARRSAVRIDSLQVAPEDRLDPGFLYVADLRNVATNGSYPVRKVARADFDAFVDQQMGGALRAEAGVVVYKAAWCGACKAAEAYLTSRGVEYQARDVEKDPGAQAEMQRKVRAAGLQARGVPVIDFDGELLLGFDRGALAQLIEQKGQ